jgi:hypothetical protein
MSTTVPDKSGNGYTLTRVKSHFADHSVGPGETSARFNGVNDRWRTLGSGINLGQEPRWTVSVPIEPTRLGGLEGQAAWVVGAGHGNEMSPGIQITSAGRVIIRDHHTSGAAFTIAQSPAEAIEAHQQYIVTMRRNGEQFSLLVDGVEVGSGTFQMNSDIAGIDVARSPGSGDLALRRVFPGWIGAPRIDLEYLTDDQVLAYVESEKQLDSTRTSSSGLVLDMPFGERTNETLHQELGDGTLAANNKRAIGIRAHQITRLDSATVVAAAAGLMTVELRKDTDLSQGWDSNGETVRTWTFNVVEGENRIFLGEWINPEDGDFLLLGEADVDLNFKSSSAPRHGDSLSVPSGHTSGDANLHYYFFFRLKATYIAPELTGDEEVVNGDFEDWTDGDPDGWTPINVNGDGQDRGTVTEMSEGDVTFARLERTGSAADPTNQLEVRQVIEGLEPGAAYSVTMRARTNTTRARARLVRNSTDAVTIAQKTVPDDGEWHFFTSTFVALSSKTYHHTYFLDSSSEIGDYVDCTSSSIRKITATDRSEQENHGELRAADNAEGPRLVEGPRPGVKAWRFTGEEADDQRIEVSGQTGLPTGNEPWTIFAEVKPDDTGSGSRGPFAAGGTSGACFRQDGTTGRIIARGPGESPAVFASVVNAYAAGEYRKLVGTYDGTTITHYVYDEDNNLVGQASDVPDGGLDTSASTTTIGTRGSQRFKGDIAGNVRHYNKHVDATHASILARLGPEFLEALWEFDGDDLDTSGRGHHGEFIDGGPTWGERGYHFGGNEIFETTDTFPNVGAGPWTLACRTKPEHLEYRHGLMYGNRPNLSIRSDGMAMVAWEDGESAFKDVRGGAIDVGEEIHVGATFDGETVRLYVNGGEVANGVESNMGAQSSPRWRIGHFLDDNFTNVIAEGEIWDVFIGKRALSPAAMKFLADNEGKFTHMPTPPQAEITSRAVGDSNV